MSIAWECFTSTVTMADHFRISEGKNRAGAGAAAQGGLSRVEQHNMCSGLRQTSSPAPWRSTMTVELQSLHMDSIKSLVSDLLPLYSNTDMRMPNRTVFSSVGRRYFSMFRMVRVQCNRATRWGRQRRSADFEPGTMKGGGETSHRRQAATRCVEEQQPGRINETMVAKPILFGMSV
jgi:hypothetical protein